VLIILFRANNLLLFSLDEMKMAIVKTASLDAPPSELPLVQSQLFVDMPTSKSNGLDSPRANGSSVMASSSLLTEGSGLLSQSETSRPSRSLRSKSSSGSIFQTLRRLGSGAPEVEETTSPAGTPSKSPRKMSMFSRLVPI
jgi:hypothetical protein